MGHFSRMEDEDDGFVFRTELPRRPVKTRCAAACVICSLILVLALSLLTVFSSKFESTWKRLSSEATDALWFPSVGSESCIRLMDIDGDGLDDIIVGVTEITTITTSGLVDPKRKAWCEALQVEMPCSGIIYGIRGYDFEILWSIRVKQSVFEIVCDALDVNGDGRMDCLAAGRQATLVAFDPRHGEVLWREDRISARNTTWNFYNPLVLPLDVDGDRVNDLVIAHGGNPTIPADVHERDPGCLLVVSGATGRQISEPFWMPDGKETYMSPVLYGKATILFGSGGETVPGNLYSISITSLLKNASDYVTLFTAVSKGVMVPPVIVDMDDDGIDDILISVFDGTLELVNGRTLQPWWRREFQGFEFYTTPAPGDFNGDGYLDFMVIVNYGEWDRYNFSEVIVLDGLTGETLWARNNTFGEFTSPLTLQMKKKNRNRNQDGFIYRQRGEKSTRSSSNSTSSILFHGIGLQEGEIAKQESMSTISSIQCDAFHLNDSIVYIYLSEIRQTRLIGMIYPPLNGDRHCTDYEPMERSGGALGDLDGDGRLETVDITTFITKLTSHNLDQFMTHAVLTRFTIDPKVNPPQIVANEVNKISDRTVDQGLVNQLKRLYPWPSSPMPDDDVELISKQTWNAYLGRSGNSRHRRPLA